MPTRVESSNGGVGAAAKQVAEHASSLAKLELELALHELKQKVVALGLGIGLGVGAAIFGLFMIGFAFATVVAALESVLPNWLALLVTTGILAILSGSLGLLALGRIARGTPPVPEQALEEARLTTNALKR